MNSFSKSFSDNLSENSLFESWEDNFYNNLDLNNPADKLFLLKFLTEEKKAAKKSEIEQILDT